MNENTKDMAVGSPVSATDADGDILQYKHGGTDMGQFSIGGSGQLTAKVDLNFEGNAGDDDQCAVANECVVTVTATDPSGASTMVTVNIAVENANDAPVFGETAKGQVKLQVDEKIAATDQNPDIETTAETPVTIQAFVATDADREPDPDVVSYSVGGADGGNFEISDSGVLAFKADKQPNYESKSRYDITIMAKDNDDIPAVAELDVRIDVNNREEVGTIELSQRQLQVGVPVTAKLKDPDGGVTGLRWQWSAQDVGGGGTCPTAENPVDSDETSGWVAIKNATGATYTPLESHADSDDGQIGDQAVCLQVTANYNDGFDNADRETVPTDIDTTDVLDESKDVANSAPLDNDGSAVEERSTANDAPKFAKEDANDDGTMEDGTAGNPFLRSVDENAEDAPVGTPLSSSDDHGGAAVLIFTHGGADADSFTINRDDGQLSVDGELDYETQNEYMVTVTATDPSLASTMVYVMISVNNKDDGAVIMQSASECMQDGDTLKCTYVEEESDAVVELSAADPDEGEDTIVWSVVEADVDPINFEISDEGVLSFKAEPSFEDPKSSVTSGTLDARNVYALEVQVTDGTDNSAVGKFKVQVTVTDVEEEADGKLTELQPQVSVPLTASFTDPDSTDADPVSGTTWQWSKSMDMADWTDITGARSDRYTPASDDEGYYLRALATYSDRRGSGKMAPIVTEEPVEAKTTANSAPDFGKEDSDGDDTDETGAADAPFLRTMNENTKDMAVGSPVSATDADGDILQYKHGGTDMGQFSIGGSGQLTAKVDLNFEGNAGDDDQCAVANECVVTVTATDPSGASTMVTVNIAVENANDAPVFGETAKGQVKLQVDEKIAATDQNPDIETTAETPVTIQAFVATDADREPDPDVVSYSVGGADGGNFEISDSGVLAFKADKQPNYESKSRYDITIMAKDNDDIPAVAELDVRIDVNNREEVGTIELSQRQLQVGVPVTAKLKDPDGGVTGLRWQWSAQDVGGGGTCPTAENPVDSDETSGWVAIKNATGATYTPLESHADSDDGQIGDQAVCLQVTANYNDGFDNADRETVPTDIDTTDVLDESKDVANSAPLDNDGSAVEERSTANDAPKFAKEDANDDGTMEDGTAGNPFLRSVDENAEDAPVGTPLSSSDDHGGAAVLIFTHGGADADSFTINRDDGQLSVDGELDYETQNEYMVTVTATDPSLAPTTVYVMISVNNKDDGAVIMANVAPAFDSETAERNVDENRPAGTAIGGPVAATDANAGRHTDLHAGRDGRHVLRHRRHGPDHGGAKARCWTTRLRPATT